MKNQLMTRRQLLLNASALSLLPLTAYAEPMLGSGKKTQQDTLGGAIKPYTVIGDYPDDRNRVFMFLSYTCQYCKETWKGIGDWGRTLPQPFKFVYVPLSFGNPSLDLATKAFYVVRDAAPQKIDALNQIAFEKASNISTWQEWNAILQRFLQIPATAIETSINKSETTKRIDRARKLAGRYRVTHTPYFGVAGKYATHAGLTNGNYQLLVQLLNALVSETISLGS